MPSSYSTNLGFELPAAGEQIGTWGTTTNTNIGTLIEEAIGGYATVVVADNATPTDLTIPNGTTGTGRHMYIKLTSSGDLTAARTVHVPAKEKLYFVCNATTGGYAVTVKVSGQTGVSVANGRKLILVCNGTDVSEATNLLTIDNATIGSVTPAAGTFTTLTANSTVSGAGINTLFASPPALGAITPNSGAFSTLSATSTISGSGFTAYMASPPAIGGTAANTVRGTTVTATTKFSGPGEFTYAYTPAVEVSYAGSTTVDCSLSNVFYTTLTGAISSLTLSNPKNGQTINWFLIQGGSGSNTVTWGSGVKWPGGTQGTLTATVGAVDLLVMTYLGTTGHWYATLLKDCK